MIDWKKIRDRQRELSNHWGSVNSATTHHRLSNFPLLIQALEEQEKRIEFLEKVAHQQSEQFLECRSDEEFYLSMTPDVVKNKWPELYEWAEQELAKYLEEKNV